MILIFTNEELVSGPLKQAFETYRIHYKIHKRLEMASVKWLYETELKAAIIDFSDIHLSQAIVADILNSLGRRIPVIALNHNQFNGVEKATNPQQSIHSNLSDAITRINEFDITEILATLESCGVLASHRGTALHRTVSYFNPHIPKRILSKNGGLAVLTIDASNFRKIEVEYGNDVYMKVKDVFQKILGEIWGKPGCFRTADTVCRRSDHGNIYYVFLDRSRATGSLPLPGVLENIADRVTRIIHNALWDEITRTKQRRLPFCIRKLPPVIVGYSSILNNECLQPMEILGKVIESSHQVASIQAIRLKDRQREMMHTLIQSDDLLYPHFQAVFKMDGLTKADIEAASIQSSLLPLKNYLYGFEALIRIRSHDVKAFIGNSRVVIDPSFLRPDILFGIAKSVKVALELDQACVRLALRYGAQLPGVLMVNLLPRNVPYLAMLQDYLKFRQDDLVLEISEAENINNLESVIKAGQQKGIQIAADDFGKAFADFDRVIKMKPHLIKFDRSLIQDIHKDPVKLSYLKGLIEAARLLNTEVLAEGIELYEEFEILQDLGIDYAQGFLLHKPQDVHAIQAELMGDEHKLSA